MRLTLDGGRVPVARRNLLAEKGRFAISVAGVAIAVLLVLVVLALYRGFSRTGETFELLPGELWIAQSGTSDPFHSQSLLATTDLAKVESAPGVAGVVPVLVRQMTFPLDNHEGSARFMALGVSDQAPLPDDVRARYVPPPGMMLIDQILADQQGLREGAQVRFPGLILTIGKVQPRSAEAFEPFAFISYEDAMQLYGQKGIVNFGMVILAEGARPEDVSQAIKSRLPASKVFTRGAFATAIRKEIDESFLPIIAILLAIGFTVGAAVVGLTIYTATLERSREFGVMKAVGASRGFLYRIVASQSLMLTAAGFALGLLGALIVSDLAIRAVPDFTTDFVAKDVALVLAGTMAMAFVASLVPVHRLNGIDPAMVFRA